MLKIMNIAFRFLVKTLFRHIERSKPYFEQKDTFNKALNSEKCRIQALQAKICQTKEHFQTNIVTRILV